jgi:HEAT repeat protein
MPLKMVSLFFQRKPDVESLRQQKDIPALIKALRYNDFEVQTNAAQALGSLGIEGINEIILTLKDKDRDIRLGLIEALSMIRDQRAVPPLVGLLNDKSSEVRWETAIALGEIGGLDAISPLKNALSDPDKYVRYGAASALLKLGWIPVSDEEKAFYYVGMQEWQSVKDRGPAAINALSLVLHDQDSSVRIKAIEILGSIGDKNAIPVLMRSLCDENADVRWKTVLASPKCGISVMHLPRGLSRRPRQRKNPLIAGFLNFMLPGLGYGYLGKWWGIMIFQIDITATVWLFRYQGEVSSYGLLFPVYLVLAFHAWYIAQKMPDL